MATGQVPVPPVLAVLRFPRTPATGKGRDVVTTPQGAPVMTLDASDRGRQVDVSAPDGTPLGRIRQRGRHWELVAPHTGAVPASADTRWGVRIVVGGGPETTAKGRGDEWDLLWDRTALLAARKVPRRQAKRALDVWVSDAAFTPVVVAFVVHVRRWWIEAEATNQLILQQSIAAAAAPSAPS